MQIMSKKGAPIIANQSNIIHSDIGQRRKTVKASDKLQISYILIKDRLFFDQNIYKSFYNTKLMQNQHLAEIRNLLAMMQTEAVSSAQARLALYATKPGFYESLVEIMHNQQEQQWLKTVAASSLNNVLTNAAEENTNQLSEILRRVMADPQIKSLDKRCLERALIKTINSGGQQVRHSWQLILTDLLRYKQTFDTAFLVFACFAVAEEVPSVDLRTIVHNYFDTIVTSLEVSFQNANLINEMVKMWIVVFDSLRKDDENNETLHLMANSQKILDLIDLIYEFESTDNVLVIVDQLNTELNLLKYEAAQLNKRFLLFAEDSNIPCTTLEQYIRKNFNKFARTLHILSGQRQHFADIGCEDLLTTFLTMQRLYITAKPEHFTSQVIISIIENHIFPYIFINDDERAMFEQASEQFNTLTEDCCDKQTFGILKTEAAKLLQSIGDKFQYIVKYILDRAIESIKVSLGFVTSQMNLTILPVQTSFLILSIFSFTIGNYQPEIDALKVILCDQRIKSVPPIQLSRVFTFLAYNYNQVYRIPSEGENWIGFALAYQVHPTTRYCAFDFLSNFVDDYFNQIFLEALIHEIATTPISLIWEITTKIIENHFTKLSPQGFVKIAQKLFERIKLQVTMIQTNQKNNTLDLNNCIHQFSVILTALKDNMPPEKDKSQKYQHIITSVWPLMELYQAASKWNLQDEIVKVAIHLVNVMPSIPPAIHPLVSQFITLYKVNGYFEKIYMRFFNQFALKASFQHDQQPLIQIIIAVKNTLLNCLTKVTLAENNKYTGSPQERITLGNALIIIQNILVTHGANLISHNSYDFFNEIGAICIRLLPNSDQYSDTSSTGRIIMSRALNTLFLCHMHNRTECFYSYLARLNKQNLYHGYDTLVFTLCVSKEIFRETDLSIVTLLIESLLQIIEKSSQKENNIAKKKKGKSKIKSNAQIKKITDMDRILKTITCPFSQDLNIGEQIVKLVSTMHAGDSTVLTHIFKVLSREALETLKKYVDLDNLGKKKRVFRKVIGIKEGQTQIEAQQISRPNLNQTNRNEELQVESSDQQGPKRQRLKLKASDKKKGTARRLQRRIE